MLMDLISCCGLYFFFFLFPLCTSSHRGAAVGKRRMDGDEPGEQDFDGGGKLEREL